MLMNLCLTKLPIHIFKFLSGFFCKIDGKAPLFTPFGVYKAEILLLSVTWRVLKVGRYKKKEKNRKSELFPMNIKLANMEHYSEKLFLDLFHPNKNK